MTTTDIKPQEKFLLWLDFETTGSKRHDRVIEYAIVLTDTQFRIKGQDHGIVALPVGFLTRYALPEVVLEMHTETGLWDEVNDPYSFKYMDERAADHQIHHWLTTWFADKGIEDPKITLAGSGVSHFDSLITREAFPLMWDWIRGFDGSDFLKPTLDMGVVRRYLKFIDYPLPSTFEEMGQEVPKYTEVMMSHRALYDVILAIHQARWLRSNLNRIMSNAFPWGGDVTTLWNPNAKDEQTT